MANAVLCNDYNINTPVTHHPTKTLIHLRILCCDLNNGQMKLKLDKVHFGGHEPTI